MRRISLAILLLSSISCWAQQDSLSIEQQLLQLELELDSASLFDFLDSLLAIPVTKSEVGIRMGYSSSRLSAGRDFNQQQKGLTPGVSYYHKSGLYADLSTFFDGQYSPAAYQSILHGGFMWLPNRKWVVNPYLERTFNHQYSSDLFYSLGTSISYDFKLFETSIDYAFLWGNDTGHRIIPSLSKKIRFNNVPLVKTLTLYPSISLMSGTTTIFNYQYSSSQIDDYLLEIQSLSDDEIRFLRISGRITTEQAIQLRVTRRLLLEGDNTDKAFLKDLLNTLEEDKAFALLSYTISLPASFTFGRTNVMISYSYSFPQRVPGEDLDLDPTGYINLTLRQRITW
jgi:hypothetical protein